MNKPLIGLDKPCYANELRYVNEPFCLAYEAWGKEDIRLNSNCFKVLLHWRGWKGREGKGIVAAC